MDEYIKKQPLLEKCKNIVGDLFSTPLIIAEIEKAPAEEVEKIVHSYWEIDCDGYYPYCAHCGTEPEGRTMTKFCGECGAKMDKNRRDRCANN